MIRDISKTLEDHKSGPDVQHPYQRSLHVIPDISTRSSHHKGDKAGAKTDKNPWLPLPRISGDRRPGIVIGPSHQKSLSTGLSLPGSAKPPPSLYRHHLKVPLLVSVPASHYHRKVRGKLGQNPTKRNRRQPKRLKDSVRRSSVKSRPADKIDISSRTKISSGLALSAIAILLAI